MSEDWCKNDKYVITTQPREKREENAHKMQDYGNASPK